MRLAALLMLVAACSSGGRAGEPQTPDAGPRRGRKPPAGHPRAFPPHAIRADGVGPYLLDEKRSEVWEEEPETTNLEVLQLGRYASWGIVHREGGQMLIGIDPARRVAFISVLTPEVARTQNGVGVGATGAQLLAALGRERVDTQVVRDRLVYEFDALPHVRFVTDSPVGTPAEKARVIAVLVLRDEPQRADGEPPACRTGGPLAAVVADVVQAARGKAPSGDPAAAPLVRFGCVTGTAPEAVVLGAGSLDLVGGEPGKLRRLASVSLLQADFAGAIDVDGDGRDEILYGVHARGDHEVAVELHLLRWEKDRLVETVADRPIVVGDAAAALAGQIPSQVDLLVEVRAQGGALELGGLYVGRTPLRALRAVAPLNPLTVREAARGEGPFDAEPRREGRTP